MDTSAETLNSNVAKGGREKLNQGNLFDYASDEASNLRRHLKTHSGHKSYKCKQSDFATVQAGNLRRHLKTHSGQKSYKCSQCDFTTVATFESSLWRQIIQMQSMRICIC